MEEGFYENGHQGLSFDRKTRPTGYGRSHLREVSFDSVEEAKNAGLLSGYATGLIFVEDGSYFLDGRYSGFGWEFQPNAASVSVPA
jgi:hypothetical protein